MNEHEFRELAWSNVPRYMFAQDFNTARQDQHEAMAFVMGMQRFPSNVILFLTRTYTG